MEYYICTEIKLKCPKCFKTAEIQIKDKKYINVFYATCQCGTKMEENK